MRRSLALVGILVIATGSLAVIYAQHVAPAPAHHPMQILHALCSDSGETAKAHVPAHFTRVLELSSVQMGDIERIAGETCVVLRRSHDDIMHVLTPEQRAKVRELHGGNQEAGWLHAFFKKMHGGN